MTIHKIIVSIKDQSALLMENEKQLRVYTISSALNGTGYKIGSNTTPLGRLRIYKKIGAGFEKGTVFKARVPTGEVCTEDPRSPLWQSKEDLILSRILWLEGAEEINANTRDRFIYLHGTNQEHLLGTPASHGCIRLSNKDIIDLFELVGEGTEVLVQP